ncbi:MAG: dihydroneopterin aldolase [Rickettsiales bacterium]|nr:dihydroneopterin aldolase [Rickettsiales bacterium]
MLLKIKDLTAKTTIGVYDNEKLRQQRLVVNIEMDYDEGNSCNSDNINDTMNYHPICDEITALLENGDNHLIEFVCEKIGKICLSYQQVRSAKVEVDKPEVPLKSVRSISVTKQFFRE